MKPNQIASELRKIASKLEASKSPKRDLVASDLKKIIASLDSTVMSGSDGPVTPFVALYRAFREVETGKSTADEAANYISENAMFSSINWNDADSAPSEEFLDSRDL